MSSVDPLSSVWIPRRGWERLSRWVVRMEQFFDILRMPSSEVWSIFVEEGKKALDRWADKGKFWHFQGPGLAILRQRFVEGGRTHERWGVWCLYRFGKQDTQLYEHEHTFPEGVAEYKQTYRRLGVFPDPVHLISSTSFERWQPLLEEQIRQAPLLEFQDSYGDVLTLWWEENPDRVAAWLALLRHPFVIADGHHRMAAARALARQGVLYARPVVVTALDDPGLVIRPFHRVFQGGPVRPIPSRLNDLFRWEPVEGSHPETPPERGALLWITRNAVYRVVPVEEERLAAWWGDRVPPSYTRLETAWLHEVILPVYQEEGRPLVVIQYAVNVGDALRAVKERGASLTVLLPPPTPARVFEIARAGRILPQKSTAFYPKLLAGLVSVPLQRRWSTDQAVTVR